MPKLIDPALERRRLFHGWAFEDRNPTEIAALRYWLRTGEETAELRAQDLKKIQKRFGYCSLGEKDCSACIDPEGLSGDPRCVCSYWIPGARSQKRPC